MRAASVDKFTNTDLEKILKAKGIQTVIVSGTAAHGAVLYGGSLAAVKGFKVIVPVDLMSSEDLYYEQATAWLLAKGTGGIGPKVTLTRADMIKFQYESRGHAGIAAQSHLAERRAESSPA